MDEIPKRKETCRNCQGELCMDVHDEQANTFGTPNFCPSDVGVLWTCTGFETNTAVKKKFIRV